MPALLGALAVIGRLLMAFWGLLVEALPWLGRIGPWLAALCPTLMSWLKKVWVEIAARGAESFARTTAAMAVQIACITAWGIFLEVVISGISGLAIREVFFNNPFSGFPAAMMFLVVSAFPVKFAFSLVTSYVIFKFTVNQAALIMARTIKFLFGA